MQKPGVARELSVSLKQLIEQALDVISTAPSDGCLVPEIDLGGQENVTYSNARVLILDVPDRAQNFNTVLQTLVPPQLGTHLHHRCQRPVKSACDAIQFRERNKERLQAKTFEPSPSRPALSWTKGGLYDALLWILRQITIARANSDFAYCELIRSTLDIDEAHVGWCVKFIIFQKRLHPDCLFSSWQSPPVYCDPQAVRSRFDLSQIRLH